MTKRVMIKTIRKFFIGLFVYAGVTWSLVTIEEQIIENRVPASPPSMTVDNYPEAVIATGTWSIPPGEPLATPIQTTKIVCYRDLKQCAVADSYVSALGGYGTNFVHQDVTIYPVMEWTESKVTYISDQHCVFHYYSIDRVSKTVSSLRTWKTSKVVGCSHDNEEPTRFLLRDGPEVWLEERDKAKPPILSSIIAILLFWTKPL